MSYTQPNPNLGRLVAVTDQSANSAPGGGRITRTDRESLRATAFYDLDFRDSDRVGWLGRHVITGLLSTQRRDNETKDFRVGVDSAEIDFFGGDFHFAGGDGVRNGRTNLRNQVYFGPSLLDPSIRSLADIKITETINIPLPKAGDSYRLYDYNRTADEIVNQNFTVHSYLSGVSLNRRDIDTEVVSMQSYLFGGNVVGLVGWRTDEQTNTPRVVKPNLTGPGIGIDGTTNPAGLYGARDSNLEFGDPLDPETGNTFTWSLVGHLPESINLPAGMGLSAHYNQSENFNPVGLRSSLLGEPLPSPVGTTEEYGFTVGLLENRISARFNWYTTKIDNDTVTSLGGAQQHASNPQFLIGEFLSRFSDANENGLTIEEALAASGPQAAGLYNSYEAVYADIITLLPSDIQSVYNFRVEGTDLVDDRENVNNPTPIRSFIAEGFELDIVGNITENWRVFANAAQQETTQTNIAKEQLVLANTIGDNLSTSNLRDLLDSPQLGEPVTFTDRYVGGLLTPLITGTLAEGTVLTELREWRANLGTNYSFGEGRLKGVGVGGALRWQSSASTGYPLELNELGIPVPILSRPFLGPEELNGDLWISYGRKILNDKADWKVQLNIRNAFGDDSNIPVITNPDGKVAIFRNPLPTEVYLSNTIRF